MKRHHTTLLLLLLFSLPVLAQNDTWDQGVKAFQAENYREAMVQFGRVTTDRPDYGPAYQMLGRAALKLNLLDEAKAAFRKCLEIQPTAHAARLPLATIFFNEASYPAVLEVLTGADTSNLIGEKLALYYRLLSRSLLADHQAREALRPLHEGLKLFPDNAEFHQLMGKALWELGRRNEAFDPFEESLRLDPTEEKRRALISSLLSIPNASSYEKASQLARELSEESVDNLLLKGQALYFGGELKESQRVLSLAVKRGPDLWSINYFLGLTHFGRKNWVAAKEALIRSLESNPDPLTEPAIEKTLARCHERLREMPEARSLYQKLGLKEDIRRLDDNKSIKESNAKLEEIERLERELAREKELIAE